MKIEREIFGQKVFIELSENELYKAHREYCVSNYVYDVECFIKDHLKINEKRVKISDKMKLDMAVLFMDEKQNEITNIYAMALAVIPYLEEHGIHCKYEADDFICSDIELNCV